MTDQPAIQSRTLSPAPWMHPDICKENAMENRQASVTEPAPLASIENKDIALSVSIATFNNRQILQRCLESWERYADGLAVEVIVIEDGCSDDTAAFLRQREQTAWGRRHLRWAHEDNVHELACTNRGFSEARGPLLMTWQDDMFLRTPWFIPELLATFTAHPDLGLLSLSRGLDCAPCDQPIERWEDLHDVRRLKSTLGPTLLNWFRLQEVDIVIRPWVVRRACLARVGLLDVAFRPSEWDEADLCFRIRQAGWKTATHGYERLGCYEHLGSSTLNFSEKYKAQVLRNGLLFHERWSQVIRQDHTRPRKTWWRRANVAGGLATLQQLGSSVCRRLRFGGTRGRA